MPMLHILTNATVTPADRIDLLAHASRTVSDLLDKPETYVMVCLDDGRDMVFAGTTEPTAYLELKSLGLTESQTPHYSRVLCGMLSERLAIPAERVYIEFASPPRHLFGWNGATF